MPPAAPTLDTTLPSRRRVLRTPAFWAFGLALALGLAACGTAAAVPGGGAPHLHLTSTVHPELGTVSGTYQLEGGAFNPAGPNPPIHPLRGIITATGPNSHVRTLAKDGRFTLSLPPGTYRLTGWTPQIKEKNGLKVVKNGTACGAATVVVTPHDTATAALYCIVP